MSQTSGTSVGFYGIKLIIIIKKRKKENNNAPQDFVVSFARAFLLGRLV